MSIPEHTGPVQRILEAAAEVARAARTAPKGWEDDPGDPEKMWDTPLLWDAVEKLVKAVEGKP